MLTSANFCVGWKALSAREIEKKYNSPQGVEFNLPLNTSHPRYPQYAPHRLYNQLVPMRCGSKSNISICDNSD